VTCRDLVTFLMEYLDGTLSQVERSRFDQHLGTCPECTTYVQTYRQAVRLGKQALAADDERVPADVPEDLLQAILAVRRRNG